MSTLAFGLFGKEYTGYFDGESGADGSGSKVLTPIPDPEGVSISEFQRVTNLHGGVANFLRLRMLGQF
jgi:hypothetical protein